MVPELTEVSINGGNKKKIPIFPDLTQILDFYSSDLFDTHFSFIWRVWDIEKKKKIFKKKIQILKVCPTCLFRRSVRCRDTFIFELDWKISKFWKIRNLIFVGEGIDVSRREEQLCSS